MSGEQSIMRQIEALIHRYQESATKDVADFVPCLEKVNKAIQKVDQRLQEERRRAFFSALDVAALEALEQNLVDKTFASTLVFSLKILDAFRSRGKARLLGFAFSSYSRRRRFEQDVHEYEEAATILRELSEIEILILVAMSDHFGGEVDYTNDPQEGNWARFEDFLEQAGLSRADIKGRMFRLLRTGLVVWQVTGLGSPADYPKFRLTPNFSSFREWFTRGSA